MMNRTNWVGPGNGLTVEELRRWARKFNGHSAARRILEATADHPIGSITPLNVRDVLLPPTDYDAERIESAAFRAELEGGRMETLILTPRYQRQMEEARRIRRGK
jgi:hypothetical protein